MQGTESTSYWIITCCISHCHGLRNKRCILMGRIFWWNSGVMLQAKCSRHAARFTFLCKMAWKMVCLYSVVHVNAVYVHTPELALNQVAWSLLTAEPQHCWTAQPEDVPGFSGGACVELHADEIILLPVPKPASLKLSQIHLHYSAVRAQTAA